MVLLVLVLATLLLLAMLPTTKAHQELISLPFHLTQEALYLLLCHQQGQQLLVSPTLALLAMLAVVQITRTQDSQQLISLLFHLTQEAPWEQGFQVLGVVPLGLLMKEFSNV